MAGFEPDGGVEEEHTWSRGAVEEELALVGQAAPGQVAFAGDETSLCPQDPEHRGHRVLLPHGGLRLVGEDDVEIGVGLPGQPGEGDRQCGGAPEAGDEHLDRGLRVLLTGDQRERERAVQVAELVSPSARAGVAVPAGRLSLTGFLAVIGQADLVVSADTGAAHLANAFGRPSVVLFGPASPVNWGPPPGPHRVLTDARVRRGDPFATDPDPALLAVSVGDVLRAVDGLLAAH